MKTVLLAQADGIENLDEAGPVSWFSDLLSLENTTTIILIVILLLIIKIIYRHNVLLYGVRHNKDKYNLFVYNLEDVHLLHPVLLVIKCYGVGAKIVEDKIKEKHDGSRDWKYISHEELPHKRGVALHLLADRLFAYTTSRIDVEVEGNVKDLTMSLYPVKINAQSGQEIKEFEIKESLFFSLVDTTPYRVGTKYAMNNRKIPSYSILALSILFSIVAYVWVRIQLKAGLLNDWLVSKKEFSPEPWQDVSIVVGVIAMILFGFFSIRRKEAPLIQSLVMDELKNKTSDTE